MTTADTTTLLIEDLFRRDVTRDIPPVIYFHEQSPAKLQEEVGEYIITGGYPEGHPHHTRVPSGIHEQYVRLLTHIARELDKPNGPELPTAWISGFYGSGKSSFAKLLGLALDKVELPDGRLLSDALLACDTSPKAAEFKAAWDALAELVDPIAVVFDIGGVARDHEHIHAAAVRQIQRRLGYSTSSLVADYELRLERDGLWEDFERACRDTLGEPWEDLRDDAMAEDHFSEVLHALNPDRYQDPMSWIDSQAGRDIQNRSANEATQAIADMLGFRAAGKTLFLVVDEVSQYIHQDDQRMLKLQSFASSLGQRLKGGAWLLVTGQEKLEDESESTVLGKLKGRFPPHLRVHLDATNIRDVVHKRLLLKSDEADPRLRELFQRYRDNLRLFAHDCEQLTADDFVEVYPMLPGHIDLLMEITSAMRTRSTRVQGDTHAIRGLIQLLGELFRKKDFASRELGALITFDDIFDVQGTALDTDTQNTMAKVRGWCSRESDEEALRVAKTVALLQLIQETTPTTVDFVARCLYDRVDRGDQRVAIEAALERLREANLVTYSEPQGYKLQSSAGEEWVQERDRIEVPYEVLSERIRDRLANLVSDRDHPRHHGTGFPFRALYTDNRGARDVQLVSGGNKATITLDLRFVGPEDRSSMTWIQRSEEEAYRYRVVWVVGQSQEVREAARDVSRSEKMIRKYQARQANLKPETRRLLLEEQARQESLDRRLKERLAKAFLEGKIYFQGREITPREKGSAFATVLHNAGTELLPALYPNYTPLQVTDTELDQLLQESLSGASAKFQEDELGLIAQDAGTQVPACEGIIPRQILQAVEKAGGLHGKTLFGEFTAEPYGYHSSLIRACLAGLLRAKKIVIQAESGVRITSYRDPGTKDLFRRERDLKRAAVFPAGEGDISPRDRNRICGFFREQLKAELDREDEAIADAVFNHFPTLRDQLKEVKDLLGQLPGSRDLPEELQRLEFALDGCLSSRRIDDTVKSVKRHLDELQDGVQQLRIYHAELTDDVVSRLRALDDVLTYHYAQLDDGGRVTDDLSAAAQTVRDKIESLRPWQHADVAPQAETIKAAYGETRQELLDRQARAIEEYRDKVKLRDGFADLDAEGKNHVLRPIAEATTVTDATAIAPSLAALEAELEVALPRAAEEAHDRLDKLLEPETPIVKVRHGVSNQTIRSEEELELLLKSLRRRIEEQLERGHHVRLY